MKTTYFGETVSPKIQQKSRVMFMKVETKYIISFLPVPLLTREYAKRNERVIGDDVKYTHLLARSLARSLARPQPTHR